MVSDPLSPTAPARVRVLVLPLGRVKRDRFNSFISRLYPENVVRLGDISPDRRPNRNMFSPLAFPAGMIVYDLTTSLPPATHLALAPFELYREPLVILAIADGSELNQLSHKDETQSDEEYNVQERISQLRELDQQLEAIRDEYPKALAHQALVFDYKNSQTSPELPEGLVAVPSPEESNITTIKTVMCDLSSVLLAEMTTMAKSFQGMTSIDSPGLHLDPRNAPGYSENGAASRPVSHYASSSIDSRTASPVPIPKADRSQIRMSMPVRFGSQHGEHFRSASSASRPSTPITGPSTPVDDLANTKSPPPLRRGEAVGSPERVSVQGFGSGSVSERSRNKGKGRVTIALGGLYMQAGRWQDAMRELSEGGYVAKTNSDHLWHAKALEGMLVSMILLAWAGLDFVVPPLCYASSDKANSAAVEQQSSGVSNRLVSLQNLSVLLPELLDRIIGLYERASNFPGESLPQLAYSETAIRFAKLLTTLHLCGGVLDDNGLQYIVVGKPFASPPNVRIPRMSIQPPRSAIVTTLFRAFPSPAVEAELSVIDRTIILAGIASVLGVLGFERKKAMIMRELISVLIPGLVHARVAGAAEVGIHPAAGLSALSQHSANTKGAGALDLGEGDIESGVDDLLALLGRTYGVVSFHPTILDDSKRTSRIAFDDSDEGVVSRVMGNAKARQFGNKSLKMNVLRACINLSEALPDFQGVLRFSSDLLRTAGTGIAPGQNTDDVGVMMEREEQIRLSTNIVRTVDAAKKIGLQELEAEYWDEFLVRNVELEPLPVTKAPIVHKSADLGDSAQGPFIYNPFAKQADAAVERILVADETAIFKVTLQNPYHFDIVIEKISLETDSDTFEADVQKTVIGPYRNQILSVSGTPTKAGPLAVKGCVVKVRGCRERRFPIFTDAWSPTSELKIKALGLAATNRNSKRPISDSTLSKRPKQQSNEPKPTQLALTAIEAQPVVMIQSASLPQSAAMVLEGERQTFTITLKNMSKTTPVDLLLFSFRDSTQGPLQNALQNRDAAPTELYEYELNLLKKPALRYVKPEGEESVLIPPNGTKVCTFEIFGKPGLTSGAILCDYAFLGKPSQELKGTFYTRQVSLPFTVTVNASVELSRLDILPLSGTVPRSFWSQTSPELAGGQEDEQPSEDDYVLMVLDFRNAWPSPLQLQLSLAENGCISEDILPGTTSRVIFPQKRIFLPDPYKAIPAIDPARQRQFVVSSGRVSAETERASRELFWYREEILKNLKARWTSTGYGKKKSGDVELRGMRLVPRLIEAIKVEDLGIHISIEQPDSARQKRVEVELNDFVTVVATITNRSDRPIYPLIRLQPSLRNSGYSHALELSKKFVWSGILQRSLPLLPPHQTTEVRLRVVPASRGEFELGACVEEAKLDENGYKKPIGDFGDREKVGRQRANTSQMMDALLGGVERRAWYARELVTVRVVKREYSDEESASDSDDE